LKKNIYKMQDSHINIFFLYNIFFKKKINYIMNLYNRFLISKINNQLNKKDISLNNNQIFIKLLNNCSNIFFSIAFVEIDENLNIKITLIGCNSNQANIFIKTLEKKILKILLDFYLTNSFQFFVTLNDGINFDLEIKNYIKKHIILLGAYSLIGEEDLIIIIPDFCLLEEDNFQILNKVKKNQILFDKKQSIAKFRGSQTGGEYNLNEIIKKTIPRLKGCFLSLENPLLLDIRFINSYDIQNTGGLDYINFMNKTFGAVKHFESLDSFNYFKYLICFDGNSAPPFLRPESIMSSGSVPIFQTNYNKYWSEFLKENVNYIKIKDDLSDLLDKIIFLNKNPLMAENIAKNALYLSKNLINEEFCQLYLKNIITLIIKKCI